MLNKIAAFADKHKGEPLFKYVVVLIIMLTAAFGVRLYTTLTMPQPTDAAVTESAESEEDEQEKPQPKQDSFFLRLWKSIRGHLLLLVLLAIALGIVKYVNGVRLKEVSEQRTQ